MSPDSALAPVLDRIDADIDTAVARLMELLAIPSISTDPAHDDDCERAADWLVRDLSGIGFQARSRPTGGRPVVVGHGGAEGPKLLFYGHYDVQPADPLALWSAPPFEPQLVDGPRGPMIRARGASDDKGQLMTFVEACRAWMSVHGSLPARVTMFFEGEEESGSPSLEPFMRDAADELRGDVALICDTGLYDGRVPAIVTRLRGLVGEEVTVRGPDRDLHSGLFGGLAVNPARILAGILATLHDADGRVTLPGFHDAIPPLPEALREDWRRLDFDAGAFLGEVGLSQPAGAAGKLPLEMMWSEPTCEINGLEAGYTGPGFKTVLPAEARAKVSFRLVEGQDPAAVRQSFRDHVTARLPADCTAAFAEHGASPAVVMASDAPAFALAREALGQEWGKPAAFVGSGGSIPIAGYFQSILGMDPMLIGFARDDDQIHSPDEKYDLASFHKGIRSWARILASLSRG